MTLIPIGRNQTELDFGNGHKIFVSYQTPVAEVFITPDGPRYRVTATKWSVTTSRHIGKWLHGNVPEKLAQNYFDNLFSEVK